MIRFGYLCIEFYSSLRNIYENLEVQEEEPGFVAKNREDFIFYCSSSEYRYIFSLAV